MAKAKQVLKTIGANLWETVKSSLILVIFYGMLSSICFISTINDEWCGPLSEGFNGARIAWVVGVAVVLAAYSGFMGYAFGGKGYEMLVSGNMKRLSAEQLGSQMRISSHKEVQEYRDWKGFAIGGVVAFFTVLFGILAGVNGKGLNDAFLAMASTAENTTPTVSSGTAILMLICMLCSGWSLLPFALMNVGGAAISYFWSCLFGLVPIALTGVFYIVGAYGSRAKTMRAQQQADNAAAAEANKPRKINYGGLPGTKPSKKRK